MLGYFGELFYLCVIIKSQPKSFSTMSEKRIITATEDFLKNENISISFKVDVTFSRGIQNREDIEEIARNIARAIYNEANSAGIASEDSEAYTKKIEVTPFGMEDFIATRKIYLD